MDQRNWDEASDSAAEYKEYLNAKLEQEKRENRDRVFHVHEPLGESRMGMEYLSVVKVDIPQLVKDYCAALEAGETNDWCKCEWQIHPDDVNVPSGTCRNCGWDKDAHNDPEAMAKSIGTCETFQGRRQRRKDDHPECPVHTKEGFILGFYEWLFPTEGHPGLKGRIPQ